MWSPNSIPVFPYCFHFSADPEVGTLSGQQNKPHLLQPEQITANTAAGFGPNRFQGKWLERTGKSRWNSLASVFAAVCMCAHEARVTLLEACQISSRYLIRIHRATIC